MYTFPRNMKNGDPNAFCFEPFFPWIYKIMLAYPSDQEKKDKKEGLPSRSLPTYYIESTN